MRIPIRRRSTAIVLAAVVLAAAGVLASSVLGGAPTARDGRSVSLELFLRRFYGLPRTVTVAVGAPRPGPAAGVESVPITVGEGDRAQTIEIIRSTDGRYVALARFLDLAQDPFAATAAAIDLRDRPGRGEPQATVTIVEYSDFQCPYCRRMSPVVDAITSGPLARDVRWVFKHFPLRGIHPWAEPAAVAAECARQVGGDAAFWKLHDLYFDQQDAFTPENHRGRVVRWARTEGLPVARFEACLDSPAPKARVQADFAEGQAIGVDSTPTLVINGRVTPGLKSAEELSALIDQEIAYQRERRRIAGE
ncbi:MAG TPA: thioredoxin domain-containing protein [Thermodesulfobacteriota bacterium]